MKPYLILVSIIAIFTGCKLVDEKLQEGSRDTIKTIDTIYISHQPDTQEKDNKTVAVVEYNADGTLIHATQYMTYPYTQMEKSEFDFWIEPDKEMLPHILDGFTLGHAEKNFVYGNNWPKYYAMYVDKEGHPQFPKDKDFYVNFVSSIEYDGTLPSQIRVVPGLDDDRGWALNGYEEKFAYQDEQVTTYQWRHVMSERFLARMQEDMNSKQRTGNNSTSKIQAQPAITKSSFHDISFAYEGTNLVSLNDDNRIYRFYYEEDRLVKAEYYINDVLRHHRIYHYRANGLKDKTVIFNINNEPEYTIEYQYTFH